MLYQAMAEGFITDDTVALDATHFEDKDQTPPKEEKPKTEPKKRGRTSKEEREQWLIEKAEHEVNLPLFEKKIEEQLDALLDQLRTEIPQHPEWVVKKISEGKNVFWYGYKAHLAVGTKSQYILQSLFSSGNLNDGKAAIPLLKGHFAPTCFREYSYRYDSFDPKYETLKYTHPKECKDCPLANEGICQKIYKMKITTDLQKYTAPACGSKAWKTIFKRRTAVECVNAYLKLYFQLNNFRYRTGKRAKVPLI